MSAGGKHNVIADATTHNNTHVQTISKFIDMI